MTDITQTGDTYEVVNPKHYGKALSSSMLYSLSHRRQNRKRNTRIIIHILLCRHNFLSLLFVYVDIVVFFNLVYYVDIIGNGDFFNLVYVLCRIIDIVKVYELRKRRGVAEHYYRREAM